MATSLASHRDPFRRVIRADQEEPTGSTLAFLIHAGVAGSLLVALTTINALVDRSTWWVLWIAWGWSMVLALHAGLSVRRRDWFGIHATVSGLFMLGIVGTNLALGGGTWWPWVVVPFGAILGGHWMTARRGMPILAAQAVASGILLAEVVVARLMYPQDGWSGGLSVAGTLLALCLALAATVFVTGRNRA